jgi:hypothetical protein
MDPRPRVVTQMPLERLWTDKGELPATRGGALNRDAIRKLLAQGPVRFVLAFGAQPLRWIPLHDRFAFWKGDAAIHLAEADSFYLDDFPDGLAYRASEWIVPDGEAPIVLLEAHH